MNNQTRGALEGALESAVSRTGAPGVSRRDVLKAAAGLAATTMLPGSASARSDAREGSAVREGSEGREAQDEARVWDAVIVGGGPAGLAAALTLGRARRRVLLCDAGSPRNAAAARIQNFVTRDGTPPAEFRRIGREQLAPYPSVEVRDARVASIEGERGRFRVALGSGAVEARRIVLCTGMVDETLDIPGFAEAWGHSVFQCPYCHGWEVQGRHWGYLALDPQPLQHGFAEVLQCWTDNVTVFTNGAFEVPDALRTSLAERGVVLEERPLARLAVEGSQVTHLELADGERVACDALYAHPPQRQVSLVRALGVALDPQGFVQADPMTRETSVPGVHAAGDLSTRMQAAIAAAAAGMHAASVVNRDLCMEG